MRDYGVARSLFSFLEVAFWIGVVTGIIIAFAAGSAASRGFGGGMEIVAAMPGIMIAIISMFGVAIIQNGRAAVDSAEYGQQMLKIARDQLEVSRQSMKQGTGLENSFADLARRLAAAADGSDASGGPAGEAKQSGYGALKSGSTPTNNSEVAPKVEDDGPKPYADQLGANPAAKQELLTYEINGEKLTQNPDGTYNFEGKSFASIEAFREHMRI